MAKDKEDKKDSKARAERKKKEARRRGQMSLDRQSAQFPEAKRKAIAQKLNTQRKEDLDMGIDPKTGKPVEMKPSDYNYFKLKEKFPDMPSDEFDEIREREQRPYKKGGPVRKKRKSDGGLTAGKRKIAKGCGKVMGNRRKKTLYT